MIVKQNLGDFKYFGEIYTKILLQDIYYTYNVKLYKAKMPDTLKYGEVSLRENSEK